MNISIGCDIEQINRFENKTLENDKHFFSKIYTQKELDYCFSKKNPAQHLAVRFCAKESVVKALSLLKIKDVYYSDIEITNREDGCPIVFVEKYPDLEIKASLSHCKENAMANVIVVLNN